MCSTLLTTGCAGRLPGTDPLTLASTGYRDDEALACLDNGAAPLSGPPKALADSTSEIVAVPYDVAYGHDFEDMQRVPDITKLNRLLADHPRMTLREILVSVIAYARDQSMAPPAIPPSAIAASSR